MSEREPRQWGVRTDEELAAIVREAQAYEYANRPGGNWSRVPDHQAARLILGAIRALQQRDRTTAAASGVTADGTQHPGGTA